MKCYSSVSSVFYLIAQFWICSALKSSSVVYNITRNVDLPSGYVNLADAIFTGSQSLFDCLHSCLLSQTCEASVLDTSTSTCYLFSSNFVHLSEAGNSNNLLYAENVCSHTRNMRPEWCPVLKRSYQGYCLAGIKSSRHHQSISQSDGEPSGFLVAFEGGSDCQAAFEYGWTEPGIFTITPSEGYPEFDVWCDFDETHGWAVIQKRFDGSVDFARDRATYKAGFGDVGGEYWIGNENLYALTKTNQIMSIYLYKYNGEERTANYSTFYINDENDNYRLTITGYAGDAEDWMAYHNGMMFTTSDADNDNNSGNCAIAYPGGWWHNSCHYSNLNGIWTSDSSITARNMVWYGSWGGHSGDAAMHRVTMRVTRN